jgi:hypothetical protein
MFVNDFFQKPMEYRSSCYSPVTVQGRTGQHEVAADSFGFQQSLSAFDAIARDWPG